VRGGGPYDCTALSGTQSGKSGPCGAVHKSIRRVTPNDPIWPQKQKCLPHRRQIVDARPKNSFDLAAAGGNGRHLCDRIAVGGTASGTTCALVSPAQQEGVSGQTLIRQHHESGFTGVFVMVAAQPVQTEDVLPVHSRVAWGPIFAGAVLALGTYLLLTLLGAALGLSINDRVSDRSLAIGAVVWTIVVTAWSLFVGGFIASLFTTGENKYEGVVYGVLVWGVVLGLIVALFAMGVRAGFGAMVGVANTAAVASDGNWEERARRNGATEAEIERARASLTNAPAVIRDAMNDPATRQAAEDNATRAAWYSVLGTVVSMLAAGLGGFVGAGPTFRLVPVVIATATERRRQVQVARS